MGCGRFDGPQLKRRSLRRPRTMSDPSPPTTEYAESFNSYAPDGLVSCRIRAQRQPWIAVGTGLSIQVRPAPRTDPSERNYRTGLLPWVLTSKRVSGQGCMMRTEGIQRSASCCIRCQVIRLRWLRRRSAWCQCRMTPLRNRFNGCPLVGTA